MAESFLARAVVLVEGISDQLALEALAARRGRDLHAEGISVVPIGGARNIGSFLDGFGPRGLDVKLAGLCDTREEGALGFYVCDTDLEDELIRALGAATVERIVDAPGRARVLPHLPEAADAAREDRRGAAPAFHGHPRRPEGPVRARAGGGARSHPRAPAAGVLAVLGR